MFEAEISQRAYFPVFLFSPKLKTWLDSVYEFTRFVIRGQQQRQLLSITIFAKQISSFFTTYVDWNIETGGANMKQHNPKQKEIKTERQWELKLLLQKCSRRRRFLAVNIVLVVWL